MEQRDKEKDQSLVRRIVVQEIRDASSWDDVVMATQALLKVRSFIDTKPDERILRAAQNDTGEFFKDDA
jgi:hypothetical protein